MSSFVWSEMIGGVRSKYASKITNSTAGYFALIVRVELDGDERVIHGYAPRHFKTLKGAEKSVTEYFRSRISREPRSLLLNERNEK